MQAHLLQPAAEDSDQTIGTGGVFGVVLSAIPLGWWQSALAAGPLRDLDDKMATYDVVDWRTGRASSGPTGAELHEIFAELRALPSSIK